MPPPFGGKPPRPGGVTLPTLVLSLGATLCIHLLVTRMPSGSTTAPAEAAPADESEARMLQALESSQRDYAQLNAAYAEAREAVTELTRELAVARAAAEGGSRDECAPCASASMAPSACPLVAPAVAAAAVVGGQCGPPPVIPESSARGPPAMGSSSCSSSGCAPSRGLYEDRVEKLLVLPPDYCDLGALTSHKRPKPPAGDAGGFTPLLAESVTLAASGGCHWATVKSWAPSLAVPELRMCTHDPKTDQHVSFMLHDRGTWIVEREVEALRHVACSQPGRNFMLDLGSNIGSYSVIAAAAGCNVVLLDPIAANLERAVESIRGLGMLQNASFYRNAAAAKSTLLSFGFNTANPGASSMLKGDTTDNVYTAWAVPMDSFWSMPERPMNPATGALVQPRDVSFVKVDAEGFDMEVYFALQQLLQLGRVPFLTMEFSSKSMDLGSVHCDAFKFIQHMYSIGYHFYDPQVASPHPISLYAVLEAVGLDSFYLKPASVERRDNGLAYKSTFDMWFVHQDAIREGALPPGWRGLDI